MAEQVNIREVLLDELRDCPDPLLDEDVDFVRVLKTKSAYKQLETALLSEGVLAKDWLRPEEDEAWRDL